jgi:hypothetical protein
MAVARHDICESNMVALCKSNGKDTIWTLSDMAWYVWINLHSSTWGRDRIRLRNVVFVTNFTIIQQMGNVRIGVSSKLTLHNTAMTKVRHKWAHVQTSIWHFLSLLLLALRTLTCALPYNFRTDFLTKRNFNETLTFLKGLPQHPTRSCILFCLVMGPQPFPRRFPHRVRSSASSFNFHCRLVSSRSAAAYVFFLVFLSLLSFHLSILQ